MTTPTKPLDAALARLDQLHTKEAALWDRVIATQESAISAQDALNGLPVGPLLERRFAAVVEAGRARDAAWRTWKEAQAARKAAEMAEG